MPPGQDRVESLEMQLLDQLTSKPHSYMFSTKHPAYRSKDGRNMEKGKFRWQNKLSPMVYHSEMGIGR